MAQPRLGKSQRTRQFTAEGNPPRDCTRVEKADTEQSHTGYYRLYHYGVTGAQTTGDTSGQSR